MLPAQVLVIEDDQATREFLVDILEYLNYTVVPVCDGETALTCLAASLTNGSPFSLVITDISLGVVSGIEVLEAARRLPQPPGVILLTGSSSIDTVIAALRGGAYDYLCKPITPDSLRTSVATALQRHRSKQRPVVTLETLAQGLHQLQELVVNASTTDGASTSSPPEDRHVLTFDRERHRVTWRGQPLPVTPIEYRLLHYLAETPNHVRSYEDIVQRTHTLDTNSYEAKHLLKSHIRNLRRKVGSDFLVNVSGTGYILAAV